MYRVRLFTVAITAAVVLIATETHSQIGKGKPRDIEKTIVTEDGLTVHAWLTLSEANMRAPLVVLLPMRGHTHASYEPFIESLFDYFVTDSTPAPRPHILNFDLRGHGASTVRGNDTLDFSKMSENEYQRIPSDVAKLTSHIVADSNLKVVEDKIYIIGASIGANSAIMTSKLLKGAKRVVMLSPGKNYLGLRPADAMKEFTGKCLIYVAEDDTRSLESSEFLRSLNEEHTSLKVFDGGEHGTRIINGDPSAMAAMIRWLFQD